MDTVAESNARLRELGYGESEAYVEADDSPDGLRIGGDFVNETTTNADDLETILRMLPPKAHLLAYRFVLDLPPYTSPEAVLAQPESVTRGGVRVLVARCSWCGSFSKDGKHWFRSDLSSLAVDRSAGLTGAICPACFDRVAPTVAYPSADVAGVWDSSSAGG